MLDRLDLSELAQGPWQLARFRSVVPSDHRWNKGVIWVSVGRPTDAEKVFDVVSRREVAAIPAHPTNIFSEDGGLQVYVAPEATELLPEFAEQVPFWSTAEFSKLSEDEIRNAGIGASFKERAMNRNRDFADVCKTDARRWGANRG